MPPFLFGAWRVAHCELHIHHAAERLIGDVRRKYVVLAEHALRAERERMYTGLLATLADRKTLVHTRRTILSKAMRRCEHDLKRHPVTAPLLTEAALLSPSEWSSILPDWDDAALHLAAEHYFNEAASAPWQSESEDELLKRLREFANARLQSWRDSLNLEIWAAAHTEASPMPLISRLRAHLYPAFRLTREERGRITDFGTPASGIHRVDFVGWPAGYAPPLQAAHQPEAFSSGEPWRIAWVTTLHGLELNHLQVWKALRLSAAAVPEPKEMEAVPAC
jgi:hypothetical protein